MTAKHSWTQIRFDPDSHLNMRILKHSSIWSEGKDSTVTYALTTAKENCFPARVVRPFIEFSVRSCMSIIIRISAKLR